MTNIITRKDSRGISTNIAKSWSSSSDFQPSNSTRAAFRLFAAAPTVFARAVFVR